MTTTNETIKNLEDYRVILSLSILEFGCLINLVLKEKKLSSNYCDVYKSLEKSFKKAVKENFFEKSEIVENHNDNRK